MKEKIKSFIRFGTVALISSIITSLLICGFMIAFFRVSNVEGFLRGTCVLWHGIPLFTFVNLFLTGLIYMMLRYKKNLLTCHIIVFFALIALILFIIGVDNNMSSVVYFFIIGTFVVFPYIILLIMGYYLAKNWIYHDNIQEI